MIAGIFHKGSGLGNQLHRYVMARVLALDKGTDFGMLYPEDFKGLKFLRLYMGNPVDNILYEYSEKKVTNESGHDVRGYDWEGLLSLQDHTLIDGEFQGEKYYQHHLPAIREWLRTAPMTTSNNICVINFRGGEYVGVPDLFLPQGYWNTAVKMMREKYPSIRFEVHTDDPETAELFFPEFTIYSDMEMNWQAVRYAKHLIVSNSSFSILPSLLNEEVKEIIAPQYHAGYNKGYWQLEQNQYTKYTYI